MFTTDTFNIASGSTVFDLWSQLVLSSTPADQTPAHEVTIQNNGAGTLRAGAVGSLSTSNGIKIAPGGEWRMTMQNPNRLGLVGDGGAAAANITVLIQVRSA